VHRWRITLHRSPLRQSESCVHAVATHRALSQRAPTPHSASVTQSPWNTHRDASHSKPRAQSVSLVHSPTKMQRTARHSKLAGHGLLGLHSVSMHRWSTHSSAGPQSLRDTHPPQTPESQIVPSGQSASVVHMAGIHWQLRHIAPGGQSGSLTHVHMPASRIGCAASAPASIGSVPCDLPHAHASTNASAQRRMD
jgi:hypothetical protein